jgi:peptide deformylase
MSMNKDDIIALPHGSLRQRSKKVGIVTDEIRQLINDMKEATIDWEESRNHEVGVALAAVQVNTLLRVVVIRNNFDDKTDKTFQAFINPQITKFEGKLIEDYEGCLSVQDIYGKVPRYEKVRVKALDENGQQIRATAEGFLARVFQHEIDHTNGIVFVDHIKDDEEAFFKLNNEGKIEQLDYETEVKNNTELWSA